MSVLVYWLVLGGTVRDLGSDDYRVRSLAESSLGSSVVSNLAPLWLPLAARSTDLEVRARVLRAARPYLSLPSPRPLHLVLRLEVHEFWWFEDVDAYDRLGIPVRWGGIGRFSLFRPLRDPRSVLWSRYSSPHVLADGAAGFILTDGPLRGRAIGTNWSVRSSRAMSAALARDLLLAGAPRPLVLYLLSE